jgi:hypothetical protein
MTFERSFGSGVIQRTIRVCLTSPTSGLSNVVGLEPIAGMHALLDRKALVLEPIGVLPQDLADAGRADEAVPNDHPVREIAAVLDLSWMHSELAPYYPLLFSARSHRALRRSPEGAAIAGRAGLGALTRLRLAIFLNAAR